MIKEYQLRKVQNSYEVTLNFKGAKVRVAFTGGNVYKNTLPRFRTNDAFKMKAIESSELFKNKEVVVLRTIQEKLDEPKPVVQTRKKAARKVVMPMPRRAAEPTAETTQAPAPVIPQEPVIPETPKTPDTPQVSETPETPQEPVTAETPQNAEPAPDVASGDGEMVFGNLGDAIVYIAQNWQIQVQTEREAREILKQHGINPKIKRS